MADAPLLRLDPNNPDPVVVEHAAALLRRGGLVAFPTETVYGLGANALDPDAVAAIYAAKGRPAWNPVIAHVPDVAAARALTRHWPTAADRLAAAFWPGPLPLVLPKAAHVPDAATAGLEKTRPEKANTVLSNRPKSADLVFLIGMLASTRKIEIIL